MPEHSERSRRAKRDEECLLPLFGVLFGGWAIIPPYVGAFPDLNVRAGAEVLGHVVPGMAVVAISVLSLLALRWKHASSPLLVGGGAAVSLAGAWMALAHAQLVADARTGTAPATSVWWHTLPAAAVFLLGVLWTKQFWWWAPEDKAPSRTR